MLRLYGYRHLSSPFLRWWMPRQTARMVESSVNFLSWLVSHVPDGLPGKTRLGRMLLHPFASQRAITLRDRNGCRYLLPSLAEPIGQDIFTFGAYEAGTQKAIIEHLPEGGTFIDVGANIGAISIPVARARPQANIICIEADPDINRMLQENLNRNGCTRVRTVSCVAGTTDDQLVPFYRAPIEKFGMGSVGPQFSADPINLKQRSLDGLLIEMKINQVDVIKIDVEGAESCVLRGARRLLSLNSPPVVIFEFADWSESRIAGEHLGDGQRVLLSYGYRLFRLNSDGSKGEELRESMCQGYSMLLALPPHLRV
jgi:FkbM family methyltransferase